MLSECGIDINSSENGVTLPGLKNRESDCKGYVHRGAGIHTEKYYRFIDQTLSFAKDQNGCDGFRDALRMIKQQLMDGSFSL